MAQLREISAFLDELLSPTTYKDASLNGLQVESSNNTITDLAIAVDAGLSIVEEAISIPAQLLLAHHGILWGKERAIAGPHGRKIELLLQRGCSLYASHLPLDAHLECGNNAEMARFFGLTNIQPAFELNSREIGVVAELQKPQPIQYFIDLADKMVGKSKPTVLPFGSHDIRKVGIITGSGSFAIPEASKLGLDLFISGEPKHEAYHMCKELRQNALFVGHYASETFGVVSLGKRLEKEFHLKTHFIHEATGI